MRKLTTMAGLLAAAAVLLAACGHSGGDGQSKIAGAQDESPTPKSSSSALPQGARGPVIDLPSDLHYTFSPEKTGDPVKDAILYDDEQLIKATDLAIAHRNAMDPAYRFYSEGPAAAAGEQWIKWFVDHKQRTTGTYRVFDRQVDVQKNESAELTYCTDEGKAFDKDLRTGKVDITPVTKNSYVLYGVTLRKNSKGVWVAESITSTRGAAQCQP